MSDKVDTTSEPSQPQREIVLQQAENVRDLGGYANREGCTIQWRRFVRSGDMDKLTEDDQRTLHDYGICTVIDLRMEKEYAVAANVFANDVDMRLLHHDFWGTRFDHYRSKDKTASGPKKLADLYCSGLVESGFVMAAIFQSFAAHDGGFAFHCRSGKDRTGLVAALLLALADVPDATICEDFALTADFLKGEVHVLPNQPGAYLRGCEAETMQHTLDFLIQQFGGVRGYLLENGVSEEQLEQVRAKLLEP